MDNIANAIFFITINITIIIITLYITTIIIIITTCPILGFGGAQLIDGQSRIKGVDDRRVHTVDTTGQISMLQAIFRQSNSC